MSEFIFILVQFDIERRKLTNEKHKGNHLFFTLYLSGVVSLYTVFKDCVPLRPIEDLGRYPFKVGSCTHNIPIPWLSVVSVSRLFCP